MKRTKRWILPALLLVLVTLVFSYGSLAAFTQSFQKNSAEIATKNFVFYVNESTDRQQSLGDVTLSVDEQKDYTVLLDGRSSETPVNATVTLDYTYDGTWPEGLVILCDGEAINAGYTRSFHDLHSAGEAQRLTFRVRWDDPHLGNYEPFRGFVLHLTVSVSAEQAR